MEITTTQVMINGISFIFMFISFLIFALLFCKERHKNRQYKTAVWLAMGKARQGQDADDIYKAIECYMPEKDKAHFRILFLKK